MGFSLEAPYSLQEHKARDCPRPAVASAANEQLPALPEVQGTVLAVRSVAVLRAAASVRAVSTVTAFLPAVPVSLDAAASLAAAVLVPAAAFLV